VSARRGQKLGFPERGLIAASDDGALPSELEEYGQCRERLHTLGARSRAFFLRVL